MKRSALLAILVLIVGTAFMIPAHETNAAFNFFGGHQKVKASDGKISIPITQVNDGTAHYYQFKNDGTSIKFFVVKSSDGVIRAAFDACDVCFPAKKGYTQDGDFMICNNCGRRFHSSRINVVQGGCNPAPLNREVAADNLVIRVEDVIYGARYF